MATLALQNVKKSFGKTDVIHGVSIDVDDGEFIVIVGDNVWGWLIDNPVVLVTVAAPAALAISLRGRSQ